MSLDRRSFLRLGLVAIAAPAIVRASSLMPVKAYRYVAPAVHSEGEIADFEVWPGLTSWWSKEATGWNHFVARDGLLAYVNGNPA